MADAPNAEFNDIIGRTLKIDGEISLNAGEVKKLIASLMTGGDMKNVPVPGAAEPDKNKDHTCAKIEELIDVFEKWIGGKGHSLRDELEHFATKLDAAVKLASAISGSGTVKADLGNQLSPLTSAIEALNQNLGSMKTPGAVPFKMEGGALPVMDEGVKAGVGRVESLLKRFLSKNVRKTRGEETPTTSPSPPPPTRKPRGGILHVPSEEEKEIAEEIHHLDYLASSAYKLNTYATKINSVANNFKRVTSAVLGFDFHDTIFGGYDPFEGLIKDEVIFRRDLDQTLYITQGLTKESRKLQKDWEDLGNSATLVEITGQDISTVQKSYVKAIKMGVKDQKAAMGITKTSLHLASMVDAKAEDTADMYANWHNQLKLSSGDMSVMGRGIQNVARQTGLTGENLMQVVKGTEQFIKGMRDAGTYTNESAKAFMMMRGEGKKLGIEDTVDAMLKGLTSGTDFFKNASEGMRTFIGTIAGRQGIMEEIIFGRGGSPENLKKLEQGMKDFMADLMKAQVKGVTGKDLNITSVEQLDDTDLIDEKSKGKIKYAIDAVLAPMDMRIGKYALTMQTLHKANQAFYESMQELTNATNNANLSDEKRAVLLKQQADLALGHQLDLMAQLGKALDKPGKKMDSALAGMFSGMKNEAGNFKDAFQKDLAALGIDSKDAQGGQKSDASVMQEMMLKSLEQIEVGIKKYNVKGVLKVQKSDVFKAIADPKAFHHFQENLEEAAAAIAVAEKAASDPMSDMQQTLKYINAILRDIARSSLWAFVDTLGKAGLAVLIVVSSLGLLTGAIVKLLSIKEVLFPTAKAAKGLEGLAAAAEAARAAEVRKSLTLSGILSGRAGKGIDYIGRDASQAATSLEGWFKNFFKKPIIDPSEFSKIGTQIVKEIEPILLELDEVVKAREALAAAEAEKVLKFGGLLKGVPGAKAGDATAEAAKGAAESLSKMAGVGDDAAKAGKSLTQVAEAGKNAAKTTEVAADAAKLGKGVAGKVLDFLPFLDPIIGGVVGAMEASETKRIGGEKRSTTEGAILGTLTGGAKTGSMFSGLLGIEKTEADEMMGAATSMTNAAVTWGLIGGKMGPYGAVIGASLGAIAAGIAELYKIATEEGSKLGESLRTMWASIMNGWSYIEASFSDAMEAIKEPVQDIASEIMKMFSIGKETSDMSWGDTFKDAGKLIGWVMRGIAEAISVAGWVIARILKIVAAYAKVVGPIFNTMFNGVVNIVRGLFNAITGLLTLDVSAIAKGLGEIFWGLVEVVGALVMEYITAIPAMILSAISPEGTAAAMKGIVKGFEGILEPFKKVMFSLWQDILAPLLNAVVKGVLKFSSMITGVDISALINAIDFTTLGKGLGDMSEWLENMGKAVGDWAEKNGPYIVKNLGMIADMTIMVFKYIGKGIQDMGTWFEDFLDSSQDTILGMLNMVNPLAYQASIAKGLFGGKNQPKTATELRAWARTGKGIDEGFDKRVEILKKDTTQLDLDMLDPAFKKEFDEAAKQGPEALAKVQKESRDRFAYWYDEFDKQAKVAAGAIPDSVGAVQNNSVEEQINKRKKLLDHAKTAAMVDKYADSLKEAAENTAKRNKAIGSLDSELIDSSKETLKVREGRRVQSLKQKIANSDLKNLTDDQFKALRDSYGTKMTWDEKMQNPEYQKDITKAGTAGGRGRLEIEYANLSEQAKGAAKAGKAEELNSLLEKLSAIRAAIDVGNATEQAQLELSKKGSVASQFKAMQNFLTATPQFMAETLAERFKAVTEEQKKARPQEIQEAVVGALKSSGRADITGDNITEIVGEQIKSLSTDLSKELTAIRDLEEKSAAEQAKGNLAQRKEKWLGQAKQLALLQQGQKSIGGTDEGYIQSALGKEVGAAIQGGNADEVGKLTDKLQNQQAEQKKTMDTANAAKDWKTFQEASSAYADTSRALADLNNPLSERGRAITEGNVGSVLPDKGAGLVEQGGNVIPVTEYQQVKPDENTNAILKALRDKSLREATTAMLDAKLMSGDDSLKVLTEMPLRRVKIGKKEYAVYQGRFERVPGGAKAGAAATAPGIADTIIPPNPFGGPGAAPGTPGAAPGVTPPVDAAAQAQAAQKAALTDPKAAWTGPNQVLPPGDYTGKGFQAGWTTGGGKHGRFYADLTKGPGAAPGVPGAAAGATGIKGGFVGPGTPVAPGTATPPADAGTMTLPGGPQGGPATVNVKTPPPEPMDPKSVFMANRKKTLGTPTNAIGVADRTTHDILYQILEFMVTGKLTPTVDQVPPVGGPPVGGPPVGGPPVGGPPGIDTSGITSALGKDLLQRLLNSKQRSSKVVGNTLFFKDDDKENPGGTENWQDVLKRSLKVIGKQDGISLDEQKILKKVLYADPNMLPKPDDKMLPAGGASVMDNVGDVATKAISDMGLDKTVSGIGDFFSKIYADLTKAASPAKKIDDAKSNVQPGLPTTLTDPVTFHALNNMMGQPQGGADDNKSANDNNNEVAQLKILNNTVTAIMNLMSYSPTVGNAVSRKGNNTDVFNTRQDAPAMNPMWYFGKFAQGTTLQMVNQGVFG